MFRESARATKLEVNSSGWGGGVGKGIQYYWAQKNITVPNPLRDGDILNINKCVCNVMAKQRWNSPNLVAQAIRDAIRANRFARIIRNWPIFIARQADSPESPNSHESHH